MCLISFLLISKAVAVQLIIYPVEDIVFTEVNGTVKISCSSNETLNNISRIVWYRKTFALGEAPKTVASCTDNNKPHKYLCNSVANIISLEILNVQKNDSGIYYCSSIIAFAEKGIRLIVGDTSISHTTVHLLAPKQVPLELQIIHLTCVVRTVQQMVLLSWNISGTHHKGTNVIAMEDTGTWNVLNHVTVDRTHWHNGTLACEVHFNSTVISAHLVIEETKRTFGKRCAMSLIPVLIGIIMLIAILFGHLFWIFIQPGPKKTERETTVSDSQDGIVYAELNRGSLNPKRNK